MTVALPPRRSFVLGGLALGGAAALAGLPRAAFGSARARTGSLGKYRVIHDFTASSSLDVGALVQAPDGRLYGVRRFGGASDHGFIYRMNERGKVQVVRSLKWETGANPVGGLTLGADGSLYGTTQRGGDNGDGVAFRLSPDGTYSVVHSFGGGRLRLANPTTTLAASPAGGFFGTTTGGGPKGFGGIYYLSPEGELTVLRKFQDQWGFESVANQLNLRLASDGNLYGMGFSTAWRIAPDGSQTELHRFDSDTEGYSAAAGLIQGPDGHLYGTMVTYDTIGGGTIFRMTLAGEVTILYRFGPYRSGDGYRPEAELLYASDGYLYGSTSGGGSGGGISNPDGLGTLFRIRPDGSDYVQLLSFSYRGDDITGPRNALTEGGNGRLYCATGNNGLFGFGGVFAVSTLADGG